MKNYRGKYLIGVYSLLHEGETLLALCDNISEFASFMQTSYNSAKKILCGLFNGKSTHIKINGKLRKVEFIEDED